MPKARSKEKSYPGGLAEEQLEKVRALLESSRAGVKLLGTALREVFNAALHMLKEGFQQRSLPHDYPNWQTMYYHYNHWRSHMDKESGLPLLEIVLKKQVAVSRQTDGRQEDTILLLSDAQSVKTPASRKQGL